MLLASGTTTGTYAAIGILTAIVPVGGTLLFAAFKQAQSYGRLETKVDASVAALGEHEPVITELGVQSQVQGQKLDSIAANLTAQTTALQVLVASFQAHQVQDATSFAELKTRLPNPATIAEAAALAAERVLSAAQAVANKLPTV